MKMFCKKCGNEMPEDNIFCPKCGADQRNDLQMSPSGTEKNPEITGSTPSFKKIFTIFLYIIGLIVVLSIISAFISGMSGPLSDDSANYYNEGVDNFNKGISYFNDGLTKLDDEDTNGAIAKFELSKDFFNTAKINFETAMSKSDTNSDIFYSAKYMVESSDYYCKGLDEFISALRLIEKYAGTNLFISGINVLLNPELIVSMNSDLSEIQVKAEKAKNYFELARNARESAKKYY